MNSVDSRDMLAILAGPGPEVFTTRAATARIVTGYAMGL
jgi:hypothetical protein